MENFLVPLVPRPFSGSANSLESIRIAYWFGADPPGILNSFPNLKELDISSNFLLQSKFFGFNSSVDLNPDLNSELNPGLNPDLNPDKIPISIPDRKIPDLEVLDLSNTNFESLKLAIERFPNLKILHFNSNRVQKLENKILKSKKIVELHLENCQISTIEPRTFFQIRNSLRFLNLAKNQLKNFHWATFRFLKNLKFVDFSENQFEDDPDHRKFPLNRPHFLGSRRILEAMA